jgi:3-oxoadipate enol-lactonase
MTFAETPSGRVYIECHGKGPPLVLVPAFGTTTRAYRGVLPKLTETHRVILYDPLGMGRSDDLNGDPSAPSMADELAAVLDHFELEQASLLGASMGAVIALEFSMRHRHRLDRLVLVTPPAKKTPYGVCLNDMFADLLAGSDPNRFMQYVINLGLCPEFVNRHPRVLHQLRLGIHVSLRDAETMRRQHRALRGVDVAPSLSRMKAPTLIIAGARDVVTPVFHAQALHAILPNSELVVLDNVAHNPFIEASRTCFAVIRSFLAGEKVAGPDGAASLSRNMG